jgi:hypothetical protein
MPSRRQIHEIQRQDGAFFFSGCIETALKQYGMLCGPESPVGPAVIPRGFDAPADLETGRPALFEGPLHPRIADHFGIALSSQSLKQCVLRDEHAKPIARFCYQAIRVRSIPPSASKAKPEFWDYHPPDDRWTREVFEVQTFSPGPAGDPVLYADLPDGTTAVVGIRLCEHVILGVPLLDILVQHMTCPPIFGGSYYLPRRSSSPYHLALWLRRILSEQAQRTGWAFVSAGVWPAGYDASLCIRHDFDRPMGSRDLDDLLRFYHDTGVRSTWFWRLSQASADFMNRVISAGHEVALHTEQEGRTSFVHHEVENFAVNYGVRMMGYSVHGGRGSVGYLGHRQFEWALEAGMDYGELLTIDSGLPYRAPVVLDQIPTVSNLWLPGTHYSIDRGLAPDAYDLHSAREYAERRYRRGEQIVIMNHPDVHLPALKTLISEINRETLWNATLHDSISWVRQRQALYITKTNFRGIHVCTSSPIQYPVELWLEGCSTTQALGPYRLSPGMREIQLPFPT